MQDVIGAALEQLSDRLPDSRVDVDVPDDLPLVPMDFVLIVQVLVNLLDNAIKYSPAGHAHRDRRAPAGQRAWRLRWPTAASAFRRDDLERVFDKFYRVQRPGQCQRHRLGAVHLQGDCRSAWRAHRG